MTVKEIDGKEYVIIPEHIFRNKQNIDWKAVEKYLQKYVGTEIKNEHFNDIVCIGRQFPGEYAGSDYTHSLKGAKAKAKANAAQEIIEMVRVATEKIYAPNRKNKHSDDARNGWYYYITRFMLPVYSDIGEITSYNSYTGRLVMNITKNGKIYLYDLVEIKKEASNPLKTITDK